MFHHEQIREEGLRAYGPALLEAMLDSSLSAEDREAVEQTVAHLHDPRALVTLRAVANDDSGRWPDEVRHSAVRALGSTTAHPTGRELRDWWNSEDPLLQSAALLLMDRSEGDILGAILDDDSHEWLAPALSAIDLGFEEPQWQARKMKHLIHPIAEVRGAAALSCLWDEPIAAESLLIELLDDPDPAVVDLAVGTLRYYASRDVVRALVQRGLPYADPLDFFRIALEEPEPVASRVRAWMGPDLVSLLAPTEQDPDLDLVSTAHAAVVATSKQSEDLPPRLLWDDRLEARVNNPDEPVTALLDDLRKLDADAVPAADRGRIVALLCRHPDAERRERGAVVAAEWGVAEAIIELFDDPVVSVRKTAMYCAHDLSRNATVATRALAMLESGEIASTRSREALRTWVRHVDSSTAVRRLIRFIREDQRTTLAMSAVEELMTLEGGDEAIARVVDVLRREPISSWSLHVTLLDACARFGIDPGSVDHLRGYPDVWLATALIRLDIALGR